MRDTTFLYALCQPLTGEIRYIGKSDKPKDRLQKHIHFALHKKPKFHTADWIRSLAANGQKPQLLILGEVPSDSWEDWERSTIAAARACGMDLTNTTDGGDGSSRGERNHNYGKKYSPERCAAMSAAGKGRTPWNKGRKSPETSGANHHTFGKPFSPETRAKMSASMKGRKQSPEAIKKGAAKTRGVKRKGSSSPYRGVSWNPRYEKWNSQMRTPGCHLYLGRFTREIDAAVAFDQAMERHFGDSGKFNFSYDPACFI